MLTWLYAVMAAAALAGGVNRSVARADTNERFSFVSGQPQDVRPWERGYIRWLLPDPSVPMTYERDHGGIGP